MRGAEHWSEWVRECESRGDAYVIVTMLGVRGSTPRESGTKMVVTVASAGGTIGGGVLEYRALEIAREMLTANRQQQRLENFPLGERLGQCCGGSTSLLFECFVPSPIAVYLFGAGHVGRALAPILATLPLQLHWVDGRDAEFPQSLPPGARKVCTEHPVDIVSDAPEQAYYLVMTHQHALDYDIAEAALRRGDASYIGLIGSATKWRRFRLRLQHRGYDDAVIGRVHCPVGLPEVPGKRPAEIAVAVAAQIIAHYHARRGADAAAPGPGWKTLQAQLERSGALPDLTGNETT